ncbi:DUF2948 family protein [Rhodocista pekingensis]|uniref:DUF2948 family protein n=1 Tax=Rhodocista pekingensis TaxID=201185 RepID=A0ABW2KUV5_9PROT
MSGGLKLRACDEEDLKVVSAFLQDAIVPIGDTAFLPDEHRFVLIANRFRWETADGAPAGKAARRAAVGPTPDEDCPYERTNCAVRFDGVAKVSCRNLDRSDRTAMLSLLAIERADGAVLLHFSGGACIRLETPALDCRLEDVGRPWPTSARPRHVEAEGRAAE